MAGSSAASAWKSAGAAPGGSAKCSVRSSAPPQPAASSMKPLAHFSTSSARRAHHATVISCARTLQLNSILMIPQTVCDILGPRRCPNEFLYVLIPEGIDLVVNLHKNTPKYSHLLFDFFVVKCSNRYGVQQLAINIVWTKISNGSPLSIEQGTLVAEVMYFCNQKY